MVFLIIMIRELKIKNFAIIDSLSLEFQPGLNILTGETGAGKSILVDALGLVLGERAQTEQIKTGSEEAEVQALFEAGKIPLLEELGIATDDGIIVRRIISKTGKTRAYINDTLMNVKTLEELGSALVDIHGQNEHQSLIFPDQQMDLVDSFGRHDDVLDRYRAVYGALRETEARLHDLKEKAKERAHRVDLLQFQIDEIRTAAVKPGETAAIEEERTILLNATRLRELCEEAYHLIHGQEQSVSGNLKTAVEHLRTVQEFDQTAKEPFDLLNAAMPLISDAIVSLRSLKERYSADPERLEEVQKRLDVLKNLRKKYGESEEEILAYLGTIVPELETLLSADEAVDELSRKQEALQAEIRAVAHQLTEKRRAASKRIERLVTEKLKDLAF
ncbi:MAG: DNA repair protein RecN, partial [bacterium]